MLRVSFDLEMSSTWTQEAVLRLAPDPASAKAGKELSAARKWVSFNTDSSCVWGLCQGSGKNPYQSIIDLSEPAFKCSCPSRKFPCKHGLGLLLLFAADPSAFPAAAPPEWVSEWLKGRADRAAKKADAASKPSAPVDVAAQEKRREKRLERISAGLASLRTWLDDLLHQGIATVPSRGYGFFDEPARRLIDAQAPGAARLVQNLATTATAGPGWHGPFLQQMASLHALLRAAERLDDLPAETRDDVLAAIGVPVAQDDVLAKTGVKQTWQILAQEVEFEDKLRVQKTWLFGTTDRRPALVFHFAHGTGPLDASFLVGTEFLGEVCYFPGNGIRAAVKSREAGKAVSTFAAFDDLDLLCDAYSNLLAAQPWLGPVVMPVQKLIPLHREGAWSFVDAKNKSLPARMSPAVAWQTMAASGGNPINLSVRFDGIAIEPLAANCEGQYISLTAAHSGGTELAG
jgi:hypothetical protein